MRRPLEVHQKETRWLKLEMRVVGPMMTWPFSPMCGSVSVCTVDHVGSSCRDITLMASAESRVLVRPLVSEWMVIDRVMAGGGRRTSGTSWVHGSSPSHQQEWRDVRMGVTTSVEHTVNELVTKQCTASCQVPLVSRDPERRFRVWSHFTARAAVFQGHSILIVSMRKSGNLSKCMDHIDEATLLIEKGESEGLPATQTRKRLFSAATTYMLGLQEVDQTRCLCSRLVVQSRHWPR